jgi:PAS domain S-box-containing protein
MNKDIQSMVFEKSSESIIFLVPAGQIYDANSEASKLFGYSKNEFLQINWKSLFLDPDKDIPAIFLSLENQEDYKKELILTRKNQTGFSAKIRIFAFEEDREKKYMVFIKNITEDLRLAEELWTSETKFSVAFQSSPTGFSIVSIKKGVFLEVNNSFLEMTGLKREEVVGHAVFEVVLWDDPEQRDRFMKLLKEQGMVYNYEFKFRRKDDLPGYGLMSATIIFISGEPCTLSQVIDITERKHTEEILKENEEKYHLLAENIPGFVIYVDKFRRYAFVNDSFASFCNKDKNSIIGKTVKDIFGYEIFEKAKPHIDKVLSGERVYYEIQLPDSHKDLKWYGVYYMPHIIESGEIVGYYSLVTDIDKHKNAERIIQESEQRALRQRMVLADLATREEILMGEINSAKKIFTEEASKAIQADRASIWLLEDNGQELRCIDLYESGQNKHSEGMLLQMVNYPEYFKTIISQNRINSFDAQNDPRTSEFTEGYLSKLKITSMLDAGIMLEGQLAGVICFEHIGLKRQWQPDEESFASTIASIIGQTMATAARRQAQNALEKRELQYHILFEGANDSILIMKNGQFLDCNEKAIVMFGCQSIGDIINHSLWDFSPTFQPDGKDSKVKSMVLMNEVLKGKSLRFYWQHLRKDRTLFHAEVSLNPLRIDDDIYIQSIIRDVTDKLMAEENLKISEARYKDLFNWAPVGYHEIDISGKIIQVNQTELEMLQYSESEMLGHFIWEFINESDLSKKQVLGKLSGSFSHSNTYERTFIRKDGSKIAVLVDDIILKNSKGEITGIRTTLQDISERKRNEIALYESNEALENALSELKETQKQVLQQERLRALGQMASGIAHDINNSLTPILGYIDIMLEDERIVGIAGEELKKINVASRDIRRTIQRMKEFYRPKSEVDELQVLNINSIIKGTIDLTKHKWKDFPESHGAVINVNLDLQDHLHPVVGNESEIREALTNLIINAVDAMPKGGDLLIKSSIVNDYVSIEIIDSGTGMDEITLKRCLEPFYSTKGDKGTGLGLSMVYGIMQRHDGNIQIESVINKGTTFRLLLPHRILIEQKIKEREDKLNQVSLNILVIDDDGEVRELVRRILIKCGHTVNTEISGHDGLEKYTSALKSGKPFELVITDLGMAHMDGKTLSRLIRDVSPKIPIILLTGWGSFIEKEDFEEFDAIMSKPVTRNELENAIKRCLKIEK